MITVGFRSVCVVFIKALRASCNKLRCCALMTSPIDFHGHVYFNRRNIFKYNNIFFDNRSLEKDKVKF